MIASRSRPPPRGPLRISGVTRAATASKCCQQAMSSRSERSSCSSGTGSVSRPQGLKEMPETSVDGVPPLRSATSSGLAASSSSARPARTTTGRYRSR
ncbi:MAG: hypothetical protein JWN77_865 [Frankiales bacterium]|jgi:hypothetical protein|nr:hypothetical protein [Frankiales bacterium]